MTIATETNRVEYNGDGATTTFAYTFRIDDEDDIAVYVDGALKTITTHYTVTGVGVDAGGTVVFVTAPATGTSNVLLIRQVDLLQETEFTANDPFAAASQNSALDYLMMAIQMCKEAIDRAAKVAITSTLENLVIPEPTAGYALGWNTGATGLTNLASPGTIEVSTLASQLLDDTTATEMQGTLGISSFAQTLLDDTTATEMQQTLGAPIVCGYATKSCADASGTEAFNIGFKPSSVEFVAVIDGTPSMSDGFDDGSTSVCLYSYGAISAGIFGRSTDYSVFLTQSAAAAYCGNISTMTSSGWIWNWVKSGATASGTAQIQYRASK